MKLLEKLRRQVEGMATLRRAWFTSFATDIEFVETHVLPATIGASTPRSRMDYEQLQRELSDHDIDFRVFCDPRFLDSNRVKRTCIPVHRVRPSRNPARFSDASLFHPKVIYLEDRDGKRVIGAGSANLTLSGWGRNIEAFEFFEITSRDNYREVRSFFGHLCAAADIESSLDDRRNFPRSSEPWKFVHSYQSETFPRQLLADRRNEDMAVWSPYLPRDLASFLDRLEAAGGTRGLTVHLVPDRFEGKYLRTEWNERLEAKIEAGKITFHECPATRDQRTELCHAKIWKIAGRLAIGSWNFTGPGSNSLTGPDGGWLADNNVEAGFIIQDRHSWNDACGKQILIGRDDCAPPALLEKEELSCDELPPFDLNVSFDWRSHDYSISGKWMGNGPRDGLSLQLPGVAGTIPIAWNAQARPVMQSVPRVDDRELLRDRTFTVFRGQAIESRGLVNELNAHTRRAQAFDTLEDLLEAYMQGDDLEGNPDLPFRIPLDTDMFPDEPPFQPPEARLGLGAEGSSRPSISYLRLFQSMKAYAAKLSDTNTLEQLDRHAFLLPGCLLELVSKTREALARSPDTIFNWFLAHEVDALCSLAARRRRSLSRGSTAREPGYARIPNARWGDLSLDLPTAPLGVNHRYFSLVREQCGYA